VYTDIQDRTQTTAIQRITMNIAKALIGEIVCEVIWDVWDMKGEKLVRMLKRDREVVCINPSANSFQQYIYIMR
jgi:hypothetical protein